MGTRIILTASDGFELNAYRAEPEGTPRGGVVLLGEVWGNNHWVRSVADRWAENGYLVIAPAMLDRLEFGYETDDYSRLPHEMVQRFSHETGLLDLAAAVKAASEGGKVGVTGYCFGARYGFRFASKAWVDAGLGIDVVAAALPTFLTDDEIKARVGPATIAAAREFLLR